MRLQAVIFDLDGVLIDSAHNHWRSYNDALRPYGIVLDWPEYLRIMGMRRDDALRTIAARFNVAIDISATARAKEASYLRLLAADPRPIPAFIHLVDDLAHLLPVALVTGSYGSSLERVLPAIGLERSFTAIVSGQDVAHGKPAPDGYLLAAQRLGVPPCACVAIEDTPEGVDSAKAAGMRCIAITPPGREPADLATADLVLPDRSKESASRIRRAVLQWMERE